MISRLMGAGVACFVFANEAGGQTSVRWEPHQLRRQTEGVTAELGRLRVPLVRSPGARDSAEIVFVRLRRQRPRPTPPIIYLTGGPGLEAIPVANVEFFHRLSEFGDVILLDQRGVGQSSPLRIQCAGGPPLEPQMRFVSSARIARAVADTKACLDSWVARGFDMRAFTVRESAADIDALRIALGASKVSLFAFSYGTHLAYAVMRDFPRAVDRVVLVGTAGPDDLLKLPTAADSQAAALSRLVAADSAIGAQVPDLSALLRRVLISLDSAPMLVRVTSRTVGEVDITVDADALRGILIGGFGDRSAFIYYPALLATLAARDPSMLAWYVQQRVNAAMAPTDLMALGMRCSAGASPAREQRRQSLAAASLFVNWINFPYPEVCSSLAHLDLGDAYRSPLRSDLPVLFVSGSLDMNTPASQAELLRQTMSRSTHVVILNASHNDMLPNVDMAEMVIDYFAGRDISARRIAILPPAFKSIADAKRERQLPGR